MSEILSILTADKDHSLSQSDLSSISLQNFKKSNKNVKKINFIEKNKELISKKSHKKSDTIIRCLNDLESNKNVVSQITNNDSLSNQNEPNLLPLDFDISIISNHSSIVSSYTKKDLKLSDESITKNFLTSNNSQHLDNHLNSEADIKEESVAEIAEAVEINQQLSENYKEILNGDNNKENYLYQGDEYTHEPELLTETEVNIIKFDQEKSKIRSQFRQRFGSKQFNKRQIFPQLVDLDSGLDTMTKSEFSPFTIHNPIQLPRLNQETVTAASIAAVNAITQPLAKIQADLDTKITNVLNELESIKINEELKTEANQFQNNKKLKEIIFKNENQIAKDTEADLRIKHLEKLQDKQFELMSQLINTIGKESQNATATVADGRESLNRFREQFKVKDPNVHENSFINEICPSQAFGKKIKKNKQSKSRSKSKSRDQSKNSKKTNSRSCSRGCSCCNRPSRSQSRSPNRAIKAEKKQSITVREPFFNCLTCDTAKRSRSNSFKRSSEFLEELLGPDKSPNTSQAIASKSAVSLNDHLQPTLFDQYLNEAKQLNKLYEKVGDLGSALSPNNVNSNNNNNNNNTDTQVESILKMKRNKSVVGDIKEVLKNVESTKSKIDLGLAQIERQRENNFFYLLNSNAEDTNDRIRIRKMVDGCVNAISNDVRKEVEQKLIDESRYVKLEAERDFQMDGKCSKPHRMTKINSQSRLIKPNNKVGFGSGAPRSISANDPKSKPVSNTNKYLGKIFGKGLLDQIKSEELEEKNQRLKQQLEEQQKLQRHLETQLKYTNQRQSRVFNNISNKNLKSNNKKNEEALRLEQGSKANKLSKPTSENQLSIVVDLEVDEKNAIRKLSQEGNKNVSLITITPRDASPYKKSRELKKQNLPSLNLIPSKENSLIPSIDENINQIDQRESSSNVSSEKSEISEKSLKNKQTQEIIQNNQDNDDDEFDINQEGTGIHLPGYYRPKKSGENLFEPKNFPTSVLLSDSVPKISNDKTDYLHIRDTLENRALDWLEQELMARMISKIANSEPHQHDYDDDFEDESSHADPNLNRNLDLMNIIGSQGLKLFVDLGQPVDQDLIEVLAREVLEEKIVSMLAGKQDYSQNEFAPSSQSQPLFQPRKNTEFFGENKIHKQESVYDVQTPLITPNISPPVSPRKTITPQVSLEKEPIVKKNIQSIVQQIPQPPEPSLPQQITQQYPFQIIPYDESDNSILEETLKDEDDQEVELEYNFNSNAINIPETPIDTPPRSLSPSLRTPILSSRTPTPPLPPRPEEKIFATKSVQCEPLSETKPIQQKIESPTVHPRQIISGQVLQDSSATTVSDLTESSDYSSDASSTTTPENSQSMETGSYFSEGAWLMSKSEGQILPVDNNIYVNLDLETAVKGLALNPQRKLKDLRYLNENSEGEIKISNLNQNNMIYADKQRTGVNRIIRESEQGEVVRYNPTQISKPISNDRSEGEVDSPTVISIVKKQQINENPKSNSEKLNKSTKEAKIVDKTVVDLKISPRRSSKNNIRIQSMPNEIRIRDSNDFERKIFSSTPDNSMFATQIPANSNSIFVDNEFLEDENDEQEVSIQAENPSRHVLRNRKEKSIPQVQASSDLYTEKDEDTLNMSDMEN